MTALSVTNTASAASVGAARKPSAFSKMGAGDFLRLMTTQMQMQDPFEPVDNKEMLAQMAQFSTLSNQTASTETLKDIASKLDVLIQRTPA